MTAEEVSEIIDAELQDQAAIQNLHGVELPRCLVPPRRVTCRNTFPQLRGGKALDVWLVLEEMPGSHDGYVIVFDEINQQFGLAGWNNGGLSFFGYHGTFLS